MQVNKGSSDYDIKQDIIMSSAKDYDADIILSQRPITGSMTPLSKHH